MLVVEGLTQTFLLYPGLRQVWDWLWNHKRSYDKKCYKQEKCFIHIVAINKATKNPYYPYWLKKLQEESWKGYICMEQFPVTDDSAIHEALF